MSGVVCYQLPDFDLLVRELKKRADGHQVVIMGDFNAPHTAWGYHTTTKKGARVHDTAQQHRLTLWNDPLQTTRVGNSVSRDTNPDLTFTLNVRSAEWDRLPETLGSDHHIIQLTVAHTRKPARIGTAQITEWKLFRDDLNVETTIENIDDWMKNVLDTAERSYTTTPDQRRTSFERFRRSCVETHP
ncbi:hypothetical protein HPB52_001819 [Rhipicephalus sanguineus]|uniref:Endonuclease/exonuclease/phosphatase domain-containing protein n=1 Tax=Rhipicephalus sanguineus TaxID=34632 RepID=A0A9D4PDW4_RHISA|nr:hypothetical protein HPB52_001819 [Rhipicephalus sanguineus]